VGRRRFPRAARIRRGSEIQGIRKRGKRLKTRHFDAFVSASPVSRSRVGFVVPKWKHNSVERNRLKRRLKEIARLEVLPRFAECGAVVDLLVRARHDAYEASFDALRDELIALAEGLS